MNTSDFFSHFFMRTVTVIVSLCCKAVGLKSQFKSFFASNIKMLIKDLLLYEKTDYLHHLR